MTLAKTRQLSAYQNLVAKIARAVPKSIRGKYRLIRKLLSLPEGAYQITLNDGSHILVPDLREPVAFSSLIDGQYEPDTLALLKTWLHTGGNFIDVGANVGALSLPMANYLRTGGSVLAIEGSLLIGEYLMASLALNPYKNIRVENILCGEKNDEVDFYQAPESHFGMGSRGAQFDQLPIRLKMQSLDALASSHRPIRAIKVDVEGFEYQVFAGATCILTEDKPKLIFEFCDWADERNTEVAIGDAQRLLMSLGYKIWTLDGYLNKTEPLLEPIRTGACMLVAEHRR